MLYPINVLLRTYLVVDTWYLECGTIERFIGSRALVQLGLYAGSPGSLMRVY